MAARRQRDPVVSRVAELFERNGYVRLPNPTRTAEGHASYKKGYEVRLTALSEAELAEVLAALARLGFTPGRPFRKARRIQVPLYGKAAVTRFLALVDAARP
jgi:hypothetical protein